MSGFAFAWPVRTRGAVLGIAALHVAGASLIVLSGRPALTGAALLAYVLGLRHGLDPDHLCAIDNATRRMVAAGRHAVSAGFLFSIGHGAVVVAAVVTVYLAGAQEALGGGVAQLGALLGGALLLCVAGLNVPVLRASLRDGSGRPAGIFSRLGARATSPLALVLLGVLFGLGLDSAAAVLLLVGSGAPLPTLLGLPLLFAAGMAVVDTADARMMQRVYLWAVGDASRRMRANVAVTSTSIALAVAIGSYEILHGLA